MTENIKLTGDIYAKNPEEFKQYKMLALKEGYTAKEMTSYPENKPTGAGQFLVLGPTRIKSFGKCGFCNSLISNYGIYSHDRECEVCGEIVYKQYKKGDLITFYLRESRFDTITLRIHSIDKESCTIHFELTIPKYGRYGSTQNSKKVKALLEENKNAWTYFENEKGKRFYSFYNQINGGMNEQTKINIADSRNYDGGSRSGFQKCSVVKIFDGKEYSEHASFAGMFGPSLPLPETFHIYRDWKVEKSISEILRRAGLTSRPEYFSGRGEGDITSEHLIKLHKLILEHKGVSAAENFVFMVKGINELTGTSFIKKVLKLDASKYKWQSDFNDSKILNDNVELDMDNNLQVVATITSLLSKSRSGSMSSIFGFNFSANTSISTFLNKIENEG